MAKVVPPTIEQLIRIAKDLDDQNLIDAIKPAMRAAGATQPDRELDRIIERATQEREKTRVRTESGLRKFARETRIKAGGIERRGRAELRVRAAEEAATADTARTRVGMLETSAMQVMDINKRGITGPKDIGDITTRITALTDSVPEAPAIVAELEAEARVLAEQNVARERAKIAGEAKRAGIVIPTNDLNKLATDAVINPNDGEKVRTTIRAQKRERVFQRQQSQIRRLAGEDRAVISTIDNLLGAVAPPGGEAMGEAAAGPFRELKRIRTQEVPRSQRSAKLRKYGKRAGLAGGGALALGAILNSVLGKQDPSDATGLSNEQKFQLAMTMAGNKGLGGAAGGSDALQTGRELGNMHKMLSLLQMIRQMQGLMPAPQNQLGFV